MRGFLFDENLPHVPSLHTRLPVTHAEKGKKRHSVHAGSK